MQLKMSEKLLTVIGLTLDPKSNCCQVLCQSVFVRPLTSVDSYASLFNCTTAGRAFDSMTAST